MSFSLLLFEQNSGVMRGVTRASIHFEDGCRVKPGKDELVSVRW